MRHVRLLLSAAVTLGLVVLLAPPAAATETPSGTYTNIAMSTTGHYNQDFFIFPNTQAQGYFWSDQYSFTSGRVAYMGLQNTSTGKIALATIFGTGVTGTAGTPLTAEGPGWTIRIPYNWQIGHYYRVRTWNINGPTTWGFWVAEIDSSLTRAVSETFLGTMSAPSATAVSASNTMFTEYFAGPLSSCSALPNANAYLQTKDDSDTVIGASHLSNVGNGTCSNSQVTAYGEWAHHEMGTSGPPGPPASMDKWLYLTASPTSSMAPATNSTTIYLAAHRYSWKVDTEGSPPLQLYGFTATNNLLAEGTYSWSCAIYPQNGTYYQQCSLQLLSGQLGPAYLTSSSFRIPSNGLYNLHSSLTGL